MLYMFDQIPELEKQWENMLQELQELIAIPSIAAQNKGSDKAINLLSQLFKQAGASVEVLTEHRGFPVLSVLFEAGPEGDSDKTLLFYNHYDVQPADPIEEWNSEPFRLTETEELLIGRGIGDNKGDIIARLTAIKLLKEELGYLPCRIKFLIEGEEEIGSPSLAACLEQYQEHFASDVCVWEFGNKDENERLNVVAGLKGMAYFELSVQTSESDIHSSQGVFIDNAAWRLTHALTTLRDSNGQVLIKGFYDDVIKATEQEIATAASLPFDGEEIKARLGLKQTFLSERRGTNPNYDKAYEPTVNLCGITSGYSGEGAKAVLPYKAAAKVDFRLVPGQDPDKVRKLLRKHLDDNGFEDVVINQLNGQRAYRSNPSDPFVDIVLDTAAEVYEHPPLLIPTHPGSGPMYEIGHLLKVPIISTGIGWIGSNYHAPNESIRKADMVEGIIHIKKIINRFSGEVK
ncbi:putative deacetylase [Bacillus sp. TS-2]|nr:putative deacetylase [Bacillus sp. TS-2]